MPIEQPSFETKKFTPPPPPQETALSPKVEGGEFEVSDTREEIVGGSQNTPEVPKAVEMSVPEISSEAPIETSEVGVEKSEFQESREQKSESNAEKTSEATVSAEKKEFNPEQAKKDYIAIRMEYARSEAESFRLDKELGAATKAMILNPEDVDAKLKFWEAADKFKALEQRKADIKKRTDEFQDVTYGVASGEHVKEFVEAETQYQRELKDGIVQGDQDLSDYLESGELELREYDIKIRRALKEKFDQILKDNEQIKKRMEELDDEFEELREKTRSMNKERDNLIAERETLIRSGKEEDWKRVLEIGKRRDELLAEGRTVLAQKRQNNNEYGDLVDQFKANNDRLKEINTWLRSLRR